MIRPRSFPLWISIFISALLLFLLHTTTSSTFAIVNYSTELFGYRGLDFTSANLRDVTNNTLGFEKVFVVGLPERSDKRDAIALTSSLTGFEISWIDGIHGESISDKALPFGANRKQLWETNLGSWRGHMNAVRTIVENGYTSALIMEDDMDWDVRLKSRLVQFADGARYIQSTSFPPFAISQPHDSPYGNNWDLLWLGHCGEVFPETLPEHTSKPSSDPSLISLSQKYIIAPDSTVPPPQHTIGFQNFSANPFTRWVHVSGGPICSFAYALSQEGARKVLYGLSVDGLTGPFDNALAGLCRWGREGNEGRERLDMRCVSVTPGYFVHHRAKGDVGRDSDIQDGGQGGVRAKGATDNIVWSARLNVGNLLAGRDMVSQFDGSFDLNAGGL